MPSIRARLIMPVILIAMTAACSGGGGGGNGSGNNGGGNGGAPNAAPTFTSGSSASVTENTVGPAYTATASDANNDSLTFSIDGGADAARFTIGAPNGALSFASTPDFEDPADANGDNVYQVNLAVSDGRGGRATQSVSITVNNEAEPRYRNIVFDNVDVQRGVRFATVNSGGSSIDLLMDVYTPAGDLVTDRPVLIVFGGGGFITQDRESVEPIAENFARRGYVAATADYRTIGGSPLSASELTIAGLEAAHDLFAAVRFFRADALGGNTFGVRSDGIFVGGESAGGVMAATAATFDPTDTVSNQVVSDFLASNGGVFGTVGDNDGVDSTVQGALLLSGAIQDLGTVDSDSAPLFAGHEEFDPVVPCNTASEGSSFTGLQLSGGCVLVPAYVNADAEAELFLVEDATSHVGFTTSQREQIYNGAAFLFFDSVIDD